MDRQLYKHELHKMYSQDILIDRKGGMRKVSEHLTESQIWKDFVYEDI